MVRRGQSRRIVKNVQRYKCFECLNRVRGETWSGIFSPEQWVWKDYALLDLYTDQPALGYITEWFDGCYTTGQAVALGATFA
jgi:hypothetical protein